MKTIELQKFLNDSMGFSLELDGVFGPQTKEALVFFQTINRLPKTSFLDSNTISKIKELQSKKKTNSTNSLGYEIVRCAKQYVGLKEVIPNKKWDDPTTPGPDARAKKFEEWIKKAGHQDGWPYCMSACKAIVKEALENLGLTPQYLWLLQAINPSVMQSFNNLNKIGKISKSPIPGSIGFMQKHLSQNGHAFIVERLQGNVLLTLEGNTSIGSTLEIEADRNGDWFTFKTRPLSFSPSRGLWIRGFWNPN